MVVAGMFFICRAGAMSVPVEKPIFDSVYYYLKIDTSGVDSGYLRMDAETSALSTVAGDNIGGDDAMWKIIEAEYSPEAPGAGGEYRFVNVAASDTLRFSPATMQTDTVAAANEDGLLSYWFDIVFNEGDENDFKTLYVSGRDTFVYYLTMSAGGVVMVSADSSKQSRLHFSVERVKKIPDLSRYYRLKVDTLGMPGEAPAGFLSADTTASRRDSLAVYKTVKGDLSLWKLTVDTIVYDTTYFKISNKATDSILAFDIPSVDTIACMRRQGALSRWMLPFYVEENGVGRFRVRDTSAHVDYYLALKDTMVMLVSDTAAYQCMKFVVEEDFLMDTTSVYKVKYLNGADSGRYLGADARGNKTLLDTVYAHLPDGQFVVYRDNKYTLMNRSGNVTTGRGDVTTDSLSVVCDASGDALLFQYTNSVDTFEVVPITYGGMETEKFNPYLGYKYLQGAELSLSVYVFSYMSADTLNGRVMGYAPSDSLAILLPDGDTVQFAPDVSEVYSGGAPEIAGIPRPERIAYHLRAFNDTTLYLSVRADDSLCVDTAVHRRASFFLKEDTIPASGKYYFLENAPAGRKALADSTKRLYLAPADTIVTHLFSMIWRDRYPPEEDPYDYLTYDELTEIHSGIGLYNIANVIDSKITFLTKNYYDYAYFGTEGASMFLPPAVQPRAGSYTPSDFHLWIDTARARGYNPDRPSFYIVKDIDTLSAGASKFNISGYFLHVMDSLSGQEDSKIIDETGVGEYEYNRVNFVKARRHSANELLLNFEREAQERTARDSVGFPGKNEGAINEYRFYLQRTDNPDESEEYYIVTEQGYGVSPGTRGYLSSTDNGRLYVGPRNSIGNAVAVTISVASPVSNEVIPPPSSLPKPEEISRKITIIGGDRQVAVHNALGERVTVFNVLGQPVADKMMSSDKETIAVPRGIMIVKVGESKTQKVVAK
jgi:hypothetical protein